MFLEIFGLYLKGLFLAIAFVFLIGAFWIFVRAKRKLDKTAKERQAFLYDVIMMALMTAPILSFAFMAIVLMLRA